MGSPSKKTILEIGANFGSKYRIVRLIGKGGMGEVYEATEIPGHRPVAIKVISATTAGDADLLRRFKLEGQTLSLIDHKNIVRIYETGQVNEINFIAMEYVGGRTLHEITKTVIVPDYEYCPLFLQICEGIKALHDKKILHRDIKPKNIIYEKENCIKILDFGIAKFYGDFSVDYTAVGVIIGTLLYMAPEVSTGARASFRSDIWSLGAIFYEMLTGRPLIRAKTTFEALSQLSSLEVKFPENSEAVISPEIKALIKKMCAKDPSKRYSQVDEVISDLKAFSEKHPQTDRWKYHHLCKTVSNLDEVKRKLRREGFKSLLAKRVIAEAVYATSFQVSSTDPDKTVEVDKLRSQSTSIDDETLQVAIARILSSTNTSTSYVEPEDSMELGNGSSSWLPMIVREVKERLSEVLSSLKDRIKREKPGEIDRSLEDSQIELLLTKKWGLRKQEWGIIAGMAMVLASTFVYRQSGDERVVVDSPSGFVQNQELTSEAPEPEKFAEQEGQKEKTEIEPNELASKEEVSEKKMPPRMEATPKLEKVAEQKKKAERELPKLKALPERNYFKKSEPKISNLNVNFTFEFRSISSKSNDYSRFPVLRWRPMKEAQKYWIQISKSRSFEELSLERLLDEPLFEWTGAVPGKYFWRVRGVDQENAMSRFGDIGRLSVQLPAPRLERGGTKIFKYGSIRGWKDRKESLNFGWPSIPRAEGYYIQFSKQAGFGELVKDWYTDASRLEVSTNLQGNLYFRVAATDLQKRKVSAFSKPMMVTVKRILDIELPKLLTPKDGDRVLMPKGDPNFIIVLSWTKTKNAKRYILQLAKDKDFKEIVLARASRTNRYTLGRELDQGKFYWRVKGVQKGRDNMWSKSGHFYIKK